MMPPAPYESKPSALLSSEENQQIARMLGPRCQSLATTVIQLFETQPPGHSQWIKKDTGVLCFVKDSQRKNYFFRVYCFKRNKLIWEHEMYNNMDYIASCAFLHTFEGEECMICFNFANADEAKEMKVIVDMKISAKRKKLRKGKTNTLNANNSQDEMQIRNNKNNTMHVVHKHTDPAVKKAKRKRNITKADISKPSAFRHISHVGWDPDKGFDVNTEDAGLNDFFHKAGVSESQLKDRETRQFIYDFIAANGGRDAVLEQESKARKPPPAVPPSPAAVGPPVPPSPAASGPPVPPRGTGRSSHNRAAPPPPPSNNIQPPPRPPPSTPRPNNAPIPPPPIGNAPQPPPPPPPLPAPADLPPIPPAFAPDYPMQVDGRTALLQSIRGGANLKPVEIEKPAPKADHGRGDLLSEIRKGFQLKPATEREVKPISPAVEQHGGGNDLAAALGRALAERNRAIRPDDDDTSDSSDSNEDDWEA